jgi:hypothetical protein
MIESEGLLIDFERSLIQRFGVSIPALIIIKRRQVVKRCRGSRMIRTEGLLNNLKRFFI